MNNVIEESEREGEGDASYNLRRLQWGLPVRDKSCGSFTSLKVPLMT